MALPRSSHPDGRDGSSVALGAPAAHGGVAHPVGLVHDEADQRPLGVEHADARGVERHAPVRIGRAVDRVDDREQPRGPRRPSSPTPPRARPGRRRAGPAARRRRPPGRGGTAPGLCPPDPSPRGRRARARTATTASSSTSSSRTSSTGDAPYGRRPAPGPRPTGRRRSRPLGSPRCGCHRCRRLRRRPEGSFRRPRISRARRAALRRDVLAAPGLGGRPAPRGGLRRPARPASRPRRRPPGPPLLRGRRRPALRGRGAARRVPLPADLHLGPPARCRAGPTCCAWPSTWPASAGSSCRSRSRPSTPSPTPPTAPSGASASWPATPCRWPGCSAARSSSATSSTGPSPSAASCSSPPKAGWPDVRRAGRPAGPGRGGGGAGRPARRSG